MTGLLFLAGLDGAVDAAQSQDNDDSKHHITADFHGTRNLLPNQEK